MCGISQPLLARAQVEALGREVADIRLMAQHDSILDENAEQSKVSIAAWLMPRLLAVTGIDCMVLERQRSVTHQLTMPCSLQVLRYTQDLVSKVDAQNTAAARINKYQRLFKLEETKWGAPLLFLCLRGIEPDHGLQWGLQGAAVADARVSVHSNVRVCVCAPGSPIWRTAVKMWRYGTRCGSPRQATDLT